MQVNEAELGSVITGINDNSRSGIFAVGGLGKLVTGGDQIDGVVNGAGNFH